MYASDLIVLFTALGLIAFTCALYDIIKGKM